MILDDKCVNELRVLSCEMITNAKSGHPGIALGASPTLYSLYANVMAVDCDDPQNLFRDRFVLSAGHGSSILYSLLYGMGFGLKSDDLKCFRQLGSKTPGHPEVGVTDGVDCSTGPLGQGVANAVGMAIAQKHLAGKFNKPNCKIFNNKIFCLCGDGCLMEGVSQEALSLAGNLCLDNFVLIYDCNNITIEGKTNITFTENIRLRFEAIGFDVLQVNDGNNVQQITKMLSKAKIGKKPTLVIVKTQIGYGTEYVGNQKIHGMPLSADQLGKLKQTLGVSKPDFDLSDDVKEHLKQKSQYAKTRLQQQCNFEKYKKLYPKDWQTLQSLLECKDYQKEIEKIKKIKFNETLSTREINCEVLTRANDILPNLFGGSADVATSTMAFVKGAEDFSKDNYNGNLIRFGVREHAMGAICNGIALYGFEIPYQSCFLTFMDYLKPALRMSALMGLRTLLVCSHDSFLAGEDGPTHQPVEQIPMLRMIPNLTLSRPYNFTEILASYIWLLQQQKPLVMCVSKDKPVIMETEIDKALLGGYVLQDNPKSQFTIVATGSDVSLALKVVENLSKNNVFARVVSMPCVSIFEQQKTIYKKSVLKNLPVVFLEASSEKYWYKMAKQDDLILGIDSFGKSAKPQDVAKYFKFDEISVEKRILKWYLGLKEKSKK